MSECKVIIKPLIASNFIDIDLLFDLMCAII